MDSRSFKSSHCSIFSSWVWPSNYHACFLLTLGCPFRLPFKLSSFLVVLYLREYSQLSPPKGGSFRRIVGQLLALFPFRAVSAPFCPTVPLRTASNTPTPLPIPIKVGVPPPSGIFKTFSPSVQLSRIAPVCLFDSFFLRDFSVPFFGFVVFFLPVLPFLRFFFPFRKRAPSFAWDFGPPPPFSRFSRLIFPFSPANGPASQPLRATTHRRLFSLPNVVIFPVGQNRRSLLVFSKVLNLFALWLLDRSTLSYS